MSEIKGMFDGNIKPCLECGETQIERDSPELGCVRYNCACGDFGSDGLGLHFATNGLNSLSVNQWNLANTPPEDITHLEYYYARFNMTLPGLEEASK